VQSLNVLELGEDGQCLLGHLFLGFFSFVQGVVRNQHIAVEIDALHFFLARKRTASFRSNVFTARKETVSPDFVLNLTVAGFFTVFVATNLTFFCAISG